MKLSHEGLRKAAILVASLDTAAADAVLDQLTPEQARQVREIVVEMDDIDQGEQRRVIDEFFQTGPKLPARPSAGVELDGRLAWLTSRDGPLEPDNAGRPAAADGVRGCPPFGFLAGDRGREARPRARTASGRKPSRWCSRIYRRSVPGPCWHGCRRACRST